MSNRIQKLLFSEYSDFEDMVLVESSFAEITRQGKGIRQVHLGLTPKNLVVAADIIRPAEEVDILQWSGVDPEIECFELVSVFPVELVNLSVFRRSRPTLKAHFCNKKIKYYELGGSSYRKVLWRVWCERVRFLRGRAGGSSESETSVSSSTSASTAYVVSSSVTVTEDGRAQVWERYCSAQQVTARRWDDRHLFLGSRFEVTSTVRSEDTPEMSVSKRHWTHLLRSLGGGVSEPIRGVRRVAMSLQRPSMAGAGARAGAMRSSSQPPPLHARVETASIFSTDSEAEGRLRGARDLDWSSAAAVAAEAVTAAISRTATAATAKPSAAVVAAGARAPPPKKRIDERRWRPVNRFGEGVSDNCRVGLWLDECTYEPAMPWSSALDKELERRRRQELEMPPVAEPVEMLLPPSCGGGGGDFLSLVEAGVRTWERGRPRGARHSRRPGEPRCHWRRYALAPRPLFLRGAGPWALQPGDAASLLLPGRRATSQATVRRQPGEPELCPPLPRAYLLATTSCENLASPTPQEPLPPPLRRHRQGGVRLRPTPSPPPMLFWTARYWYRPFPRSTFYRRLMELLASGRAYRDMLQAAESSPSVTSTSNSNTNCSNGSSCRTRSAGSDEETVQCCSQCLQNEESQTEVEETKPKSSALQVAVEEVKEVVERAVERGDFEVCEDVRALRLALRPRKALCVWSLDSNCLAQELTFLDRQLLLQVPVEELQVLVRKRSSKATPRLRALLAFGHRIACLVATEVLRYDCERIRARLISRFINVAVKCHRMQNFQSCYNVLAGLQSVPIFRLTQTWAYMRQRHATKYSLLEQLCRRYRDPRTPSFQHAFHKAMIQPPFIPFVGDLIIRLFGYLPDTYEPYMEYIRSGFMNRLESMPPQASIYQNLRKNVPMRSCDTLNDTVHRKLKENGIKHTNSNILPLGNNFFDSRSYTAVDLESLSIVDISNINLYHATLFLKESQYSAEKYVLDQRFLAREYLLKARYEEDIDNYMRSIVLE